MSAPEGPEFSTGAPLPPAETQQPTEPLDLPEREEWTTDPHFGRIPVVPTEPTWGAAVTKAVETGAFAIDPRDVLPEVDTTAPSFDQIPLSGEGEATVEVAPVAPPTPQIEAAEPAEQAPTPPSQPDEETAVTVDEAVSPAAPGSGRHTLIETTEQAPEEQLGQLGQPKAPKPKFPKRVPQAELPAIATAIRATRVGEFTAHCLVARRTALADLAEEAIASGVSPAQTDKGKGSTAAQGSPTAGQLFLKGVDLAGLDHTPAIGAAEPSAPTITTILGEGIQSRNEVMRWPGGDEVKPDAQ